MLEKRPTENLKVITLSRLARLEAGNPIYSLSGKKCLVSRPDFEFILHSEHCSSFSPTDGLVTWPKLAAGLRAAWWAGKDCWRRVCYLHHQRFFETTFGKDLSVMLMHRSCFLKVYSVYLLNDSIAIIP